MAVGEVEGGPAEFQVAPLAAEWKRFTDRQVLVQLCRLPELRDGSREVAVHAIRWLHKRVLVEVRAGLTGGIPIRIQQRLPRHEGARRITGPEQVLAAADSNRSAALIPLDAGDQPVTQNASDHRMRM